jgi:tryptophanyl-tRNA synthetase
VKTWVSLQHTAESIFCIVDYHAIIAAYEPAQLRLRRR